MSWNPSDVYRAWDEINHGLVAVMKQLPAETLQFLAFRASDRIIRQKAAEGLDWLKIGRASRLGLVREAEFGARSMCSLTTARQIRGR